MNEDQRRKNAIVNEFVKLGAHPTQPMTTPVFYQLLDKINGGAQFDRGTGAQLIQQHNPAGDSITVSGFADVWLEAEKRLLAKINNTEGNVHRVEARLREIDQRILKEQAHPSPSQRMLVFKVLDSRGFSRDGQNAFEVSVGDKSTGLVTTEQFLKERFSIPLDANDRIATLLVNPSPDFLRFESKQDFNLQEFNDRKIHLKEVETPTVQGGTGQLSVNLQVVNNRLEYYQSLKEEYEDLHVQTQTNLSDLAVILEYLYQPFPALSGDPQKYHQLAQRATIGGKSSFGHEFSAMGPGGYPQGPGALGGYSTMGPAQFMKPELKEGANLAYMEPAYKGKAQELSPFSTAATLKHFHDFIFHLFYVMFFILAFALIVSLWRPVFLPLMVSASYISWYFLKEDKPDLISYTVSGALLFVAIVLDVAWLSVYWSNIWDTPYIDSASQDGLRMWALVCSVLLLVAEAVGCFYCFALSGNERIIKSTR